MSVFSLSSDAQAQPFKGEKIEPDVTSGHLHHLTPDQQAALTTFKEIIAKGQLYSPDKPHPTHDDPSLLCVPYSTRRHPNLTSPSRRFLRARRFDAQKAMKQFADSETWRKKHNVDALYATFPIDEFEGARRFYPRWTGRRDKVR